MVPEQSQYFRHTHTHTKKKKKKKKAKKKKKILEKKTLACAKGWEGQLGGGGGLNHLPLVIVVKITEHSNTIMSSTTLTAVFYSFVFINYTFFKVSIGQCIWRFNNYFNHSKQLQKLVFINFICEKLLPPEPVFLMPMLGKA